MVAFVIALALVTSLLIGGLTALKQRQTPVSAAPLPHPCLQAAPAQTLGVVAVGMAQGNVVLLRASDGQPLWTYHGEQPNATPLIWGPTIIVSAGTNQVFALALNDGRLLWRTTIGTLSAVGTPVTLDCGVALVNEDHGGLVALRISDGHRLWSYQDYPTPQELTGKVYPYLETPLLLTADDGVAYVASERLQRSSRHQALIWSVKGLRETDGRLLWQTQPQQPDPHYQQPNPRAGVTLTLDAPPFSGVALGQTLYLIQVATHPNLLAYQAATGTLRWQREPAIAIGVPQFTTFEGRIFLAGFAFNPIAADGQLYLELET